MVDKTAAEFKALDDITGGVIHIGCAESNEIKHLTRRIKVVQAQVPGIQIHLNSGDTNDLAERLDQSMLDFAVIIETVGQLYITDTLNLTYRQCPGTGGAGEYPDLRQAGWHQ